MSRQPTSTTQPTRRHTSAASVLAFLSTAMGGLATLLLGIKTIQTLVSGEGGLAWLAITLALLALTGFIGYLATLTRRDPLNSP